MDDLTVEDIEREIGDINYEITMPVHAIDDEEEAEIDMETSRLLRRRRKLRAELARRKAAGAIDTTVTTTHQ